MASQEEVRWKVGINCSCGEPIYVYISELSDKYVEYSYVCIECKRTGLWRPLAMALVDKWKKR